MDKPSASSFSARLPASSASMAMISFCEGFCCSSIRSGRFTFAVEFRDIASPLHSMMERASIAPSVMKMGDVAAASATSLKKWVCPGLLRYREELSQSASSLRKMKLSLEVGITRTSAVFPAPMISTSHPN